MRLGVRLGVDLGQARVGVAVCDPAGLLATPVETVPAGDATRTAVIERLAALVAEHAAVEVVLGLPRSLSGAEGPAAVATRAFGGRLAAALDPIPVRLVDERLSTVEAERGLLEHGRRGARHGAKRRKVVDQAAAVIILQTALDTERTRGAAPGEFVRPSRPDVPRPQRPGDPGE